MAIREMEKRPTVIAVTVPRSAATEITYCSWGVPAGGHGQGSAARGGWQREGGSAVTGGGAALLLQLAHPLLRCPLAACSVLQSRLGCLKPGCCMLTAGAALHETNLHPLQACSTGASGENNVAPGQLRRARCMGTERLPAAQSATTAKMETSQAGQAAEASRAPVPSRSPTSNPTVCGEGHDKGEPPDGREEVQGGAGGVGAGHERQAERQHQVEHGGDTDGAQQSPGDVPHVPHLAPGGREEGRTEADTLRGARGSAGTRARQGKRAGQGGAARQAAHLLCRGPQGVEPREEETQDGGAKEHAVGLTGGTREGAVIQGGARRAGQVDAAT